MNDAMTLNMAIETCLIEFKNQKFKDDGLDVVFPNPLFRTDVFDLLERYSTIVYYPVEGDNNNGFQVKDVPFCDGSLKDFVFINTAQTLEKQVFTAAHELGHLWNVDKYVINSMELEPNEGLSEQIINRFAAVLLIPQESFVPIYEEELSKIGDDTGKISISQLIKLIVILMNHFFVPMKAIVLRLTELGYFSEEIANLLLGNRYIKKEDIDECVSDWEYKLNFLTLTTPSRNKWIEGLAEYLDIAEKKNLVPQEKIDNLRKHFNLEKKQEATEITEIIYLSE